MAETMQTLVTDGKGKVWLEDCPLPEIGACDALVKTVSCGVCNGTDGKLIHGMFKGFDASDYPLMLGHEGVGRVVKTGAKVTSYKEGDIVLLPFAGPLGSLGSGWGAFSEYGIVTDAAALQKEGIQPYTKEFLESACAQTVLPTWVDPVKGAMIITLREVLSAIRYFGMEQDDSVLIFGCGPVGLTFIKFMSLLGIGPVVALDIVDEKLASARHAGATHTFNSVGEGLEEKLAAVLPDGADYVLDAVGVTAIINQGMRFVKDRGKICCYGISTNMEANINWSPAPYNWQLVFQQMPSKYEEGEATKQVLEWLESGRISLDDYISDIVVFEDILDAFDRLEKKRISKKCIIKYE